MKIRNILKQKRTGNTWGYLMHIVGQLGMVMQVINMGLLIVTTSTLLQTRGMNVPVWLLGLLAVTAITSAGVVIYKIGLPSFFGAWNQQWYEHNNPLRKDIERIKEVLGISPDDKEELKRDGPRYVQVCNPKTKHYVKIDRHIGGIVSHKKSPGAYKGIQVIGERYDLKARV